jgi:hypothetical protein
MRPSFRFDPGLFVPVSERAGTQRHTLPGLAPEPECVEPDATLGGLADDFFAAGDEAHLEEPEPLELEEAPVTMVVRTPEMDARRARFTRVVAGAVGCFAAFLAFGVVMNAARAASAEPEQVPAPKALAAAMVAAPKAPAPTLAPRPKASRAEPAPVVRTPEPPVAVVPAPARPKQTAPSSPAFVAPAPVAPAPRVVGSPTRASVANFAARASDPVKSASAPPTASFALTP